MKDFIHVTSVIRLPSLLAVHPSLPVKNVAELIALAKSKPGALYYASAGVGNFSHLEAELFAQKRRHQDGARALQGHRPVVARADRRRSAAVVQQRLDAVALRQGEASCARWR